MCKCVYNFMYLYKFTCMYVHTYRYVYVSSPFPLVRHLLLIPEHVSDVDVVSGPSLFGKLDYPHKCLLPTPAESVGCVFFEQNDT